MDYIEFMNYNVAGRRIREAKRVLLYGSCLFFEHLDVVEEYSRGRVPLAVCLEKTHVNMVITKLAGVLARVPLEELVVLTVDGSLHCVQLHMAVEEALKISSKQLKVRHLVLERGEVIEVGGKSVKTARYLSKVEKLLSR